MRCKTELGKWTIFKTKDKTANTFIFLKHWYCPKKISGVNYLKRNTFKKSLYGSVDIGIIILKCITLFFLSFTFSSKNVQIVFSISDYIFKKKYLDNIISLLKKQLAPLSEKKFFFHFQCSTINVTVWFIFIYIYFHTNSELIAVFTSHLHFSNYIWSHK